MKLSEKKITIISLLSLLLFIWHCDNKKISDPFLGLEINDFESSWKKQIDSLIEYNLVSDEQIFPEKSDKRKHYKTVDFKFFWKNGKDSVPVYLTPNVDGYYLGKLRSVKLDLGRDYFYTYDGKKVKTRNIGPIPSKDLLLVRDWLIQKYGIPMDTIGTFEAPNSLEEFKKEDSDEFSFPPSLINDTYIPIEKDPFLSRYNCESKNGTLVWNLPNGKLELYSRLEDSKKDNDSTLVEYREAYVLFKSKNLYKELSKISDSINQILVPNSVINIKRIWPSWSKFKGNGHDTKFQLRFSEPFVTAREVEGKITNFKMSYIFKNIFGDEIHRIDDVEINLRHPIEYQFGGLRITKMIDYGSTWTYNKMYYRKFEELKKYRDKLKIDYEITAIVFNDGSVMKK